MRAPQQSKFAGSRLLAAENGLARCAVAINADEPPEWIELIPAGQFSAVDGRGPFENSDPDSIVAASIAKMPQVGLVLDYDHSTDLAAPEGRPAPAAGWLKEFKIEGGAIFARIEWTFDAAEAVKAKKYRYVSPVFEHSKDGKVERILRAALTNNPALTELPAIMAKKEKMAAGDKSIGEIVAGLEELFPDMPPRKILEIAEAALNGGGDEQEAEEGDGMTAGDDPYDNEDAEQMTARQHDEMAKCSTDEERAAMAAKHAAEKERFAKRVKGLEIEGRPGGASAHMSSKISKAAIDAAVAKHPMVVQMASDLNTMRSERAKDAATQKVDAAIREGRLVPSQREWGIAYCTSEPGGFDQFIGAQPKIVQAGADGTFTGRIGDPPADELTKRELMVCEKLGITAEQFAAAKKARLSYNVHLD